MAGAPIIKVRDYSETRVCFPDLAMLQVVWRCITLTHIK
jgi:hypothetical protein